MTKETKEKKEINLIEVTERFVLKSDHLIEVQKVPVYDIEAFAGIHSAELNEFQPEELVEIRNMPPCDGVMYVRGESMYPVLFNGDLVAFKIVQSRRAGLCFGKIHIVAFIEDGEEFVVVKYLKESSRPGHYTLESHNPDYAPKEIPRDSVRAIAIVKGSSRLY